MPRYDSRSDVEFDARYDDRRSTVGPRGSRVDDRYGEIDVDFRRGSGPVPARERQSILVKERDDFSERRGTTPAFLRDDYGQSTAGAMVLRERDREDITYSSRRQRSPSPERRERDEIIIRRDERSESRPAAPRPRPREQSREREEIIIRRDERSESRPPAPRPRPREQSREREEIIIRRDSRSESRPAPPRVRERSRDREEIIIRRDERDERESVAPSRRTVRDSERDREEIIVRRDDRDTRSRIVEDDLVSHRSYRPPPPPARTDVDRSEIIIRREQIESDDRIPTRRSKYEDEVLSNRPISRERARSRANDSVSDEEIIIRRDEREGRGGEQSRQEIIIRRSSRSRSPSPAASVSTRAAPAPMPMPEPQVIYAPQIHQEVITHHRHVDHGYEVRNPRRENVYSRPPSPPSPPPPPAPVSVRGRSRSMSEERIEIRRSETRNGRSENENITITRNERSESRGPPPSRAAETRMREEEHEEIDYSSRRGRSDWEERNISEEAEYYNDRALSRGHPGEAYHGATRDWGLVDIPPGTRRVRMDGAGGGGQEISWKRYDGNRRAKFFPDGDMDEGYTTDPGRHVSRPAPIREPSPEPLPPTIGPRYGNRRDPRDGLWTEVTKDLVLKEAIQEMGFEFQETDEHYYIFKYMDYADVARLVGLSEDIKKERLRRINEIRWENAARPHPPIEPAPPRLAIEAAPSRRSDRGGWEREDERYIEREVVYRGGRPPPPPGWRR